MPYDIFVSHARADAALSMDLATLLRGAGLRVFLAEDSVPQGDNIPHALHEGLGDAAVAVVLIRPGSGASYWLSAEVRAAAAGAMAGQSLLVPLLINDARFADLPEPLRRFRALRLDPPDDLETVAAEIVRLALEARRGASRSAAELSPPTVPAVYVETGAGLQILEAIEASIRDQSGPVRVVGPAGAGKTTATAAACRAAGDRYETVAWITARTEHAVTRGLAQLARNMGVPDTGGPEAELAAAALAGLANAEGQWLVVFDDAEGSEGWLDRWVPPTSPSGTSVVIARHLVESAWPAVVVNPLDEHAGAKFLELSLGTSLDSPARAAVVRLLAQTGAATPLSLGLLAAWLRRDNGKIEDRVARLSSALEEGPSSDQAWTVASRVAVVLRDLIERRPVAERIGHVLAITGETLVPTVLITEAADDPFLASDSHEVEQTLAELHARGLVNATAAAIATHPVVAHLMRSPAGPADALRFLARAVGRRRNVTTPDDRELSLTTDLARHGLHAGLWMASREATEASAELSLEVARVLGDAGEATSAIALLGETLAHCERELGPADPVVLTARVRLALAMQAQGRLTEASELLERTLADSERVLGPDHPGTLSTRANLAAALQAQGRLTEASELLERTLADSERVLGPDHPSTLTIRTALAGVLRETGQVEKALSLLERTLADSERVLGPDHPSTIGVREGLAMVLLLKGRTAEAAVLLERAVRDGTRLFGPDYPSTLSARANLAVAMQAAGRTDEADAVLVSTLAASERLLGVDDPLTATIRENLVHVRASRGGDR